MQIITNVRARLFTTRSVWILIAVLGITAVVVSVFAFKPSQASANIFDQVLYNVCHDHQDNNSNHELDLLDPICAHVENGQPVALNQSLTTDEDVAVSTTLTGTDPDEAGGYTDDILYFTISMLPTHGTLSCGGNPCNVLDAYVGSTANGGMVPNVTYTPEANWSGDDEFDFTASDGLLEDDATVTIHVNAVEGNGGGDDNNPPALNCSTGVGSPLLVDVTQQISNDPDSSVSGPNWASDNFTRHIQIWAEGDHYCGKASDTGTFTTFGGETGISPQSGAAMPSVFTGSMVGGTHGVLTGAFNASSAWGNTGAVPAQDCGNASCSMTSLWVQNYFPGGNYAYSPSPVDASGDWSWTYTACGHGSWTNQNAGNTGDIVEGPTSEDCSTPPTDDTPAPTVTWHAQCSDGIDNDNDGRVDYPSDASCVDASDDSEGNDAGAFFASSGGNTGGSGSIGGGVVLGASTDTPSCSIPLITSFLRMGRSNPSDQVKKLQEFLNLHMNAQLEVTGIFNSSTNDAVKAFQIKYADDVLKPWKPFGLKDGEATGFVYKTTQRMINILSCSSLNLPVPQLP